jgi:hypothetical protein
LLFALLSCEQPFKAGLGPVIDLQDPTIVLDAPVAGDYIRGVVDFTGRAADDYKLDTVWFNISNYPMPEDPTEYEQLNYPLPSSDYKKMKIGDAIFYKITNTSGDTRNITWKFSIDTKLLNENGERVFPDADIKFRLRVTDSVGKEAITDEIVFYIKNDIPDIDSDTPMIVKKHPREAEDGDVGGEKLNYGHMGAEFKLPEKRLLNIESDLTIRISDLEGIYRGKQKFAIIDDDGNPRLDREGNPVLDIDGNFTQPNIDRNPREIELFPPQIRFWQVDINGSAAGYENAFPAGYNPTEHEVPWANLGPDIFGDKGVGTLDGGDGEKNLLYNYKLPDKAGQFYAFQVRAQSVDKVHSEAVYPQDYFLDFKSKSQVFKEENSYVLIRVIEPLEYPAIELYELQDIYGVPRGGKPVRGEPANGATVGVMQYNTLLKDEITGQDITPPMIIDGQHSYVDSRNVIKNGAFKLRVKASHSQDLASVKVIWEKDDKSERGRFIWDWVDPSKAPYNNSQWGGNFDRFSNSKPYFTWGLNEWDGVGKTTSNTTVRNFIFTYKDDGKDDVPNTTDYNEIVRGKAKVQRYKGPESVKDDKGNTRKLNQDEWPEEMANWDEVTTLKDGTYDLYIYATSMGGTRIANPFTLSITIDRQKPEIALNDIIGKVEDVIDDDRDDPELAVTVNGVIQPRFSISDSRVGSTTYFEIPSTPGSDKTFYPERMFILVKETGNNGKIDKGNMPVKEAMDKHFALGKYYDGEKNIWPQFNTSGVPEIPGVPVLKHGLIITTPEAPPACLIRTSKIYHIPPPPSQESDFLEDGTYWVYAFVRDRAFNVGSTSFPIKVDYKSDWPKFEWDGNSIDPKVTKPDSKDDAPNSVTGSSFIVKDLIRNKLEPGASILVNISDDDSLDLGVLNGDPSGIKITFIGSQPNTAGEIVPRPTADLITLLDADVKKAFTPQTLNSKNQRIAARSSKGTISQTVLLDKIKAGNNYDDLFVSQAILDAARASTPFPSDPTADPPVIGTVEAQRIIRETKDSYGSLPDGIYRVGITVKDYKGAKLKMETPFATASDPNPADEVTVTIRNNLVVPAPDPDDPLKYLDKEDYFWIAVDTKFPVIDIKYIDSKKPETESWTRPSGSPISTKEGERSPLVGSVSDENGPISLVKWEVRNLQTNGIVSGWYADRTPDKQNIPAPNDPNDKRPIVVTDGIGNGFAPQTPPYKGGKWWYDFHYEMDMNGKNEGAYNFEVTFKDRFGNETTQALTYAVDTEPPRVSLMKPIETFSRSMLDDADLKPGVYPQQSNTPQIKYTELNKERLAVKTVNFSINVSDNYKVVGVRWWLLPWNVGASDALTYKNQFDGSGIISSYDAFPSDVYKNDPGTYYTATGGGAFGYIDKGGQLTIAIDTTKMETKNGEYRLHIIAMDDAGNTSTFVSPAIVPNSRVFQEVFFLQEEDRPYFGENKNQTDTNGNTTNNIAPGYAIEGPAWPKKADNTDVDMEVRRGNIFITGTIFENNGFLAKTPAPASPYDVFWKDSITIWFSDSDADAEKNLPSTWEDDVRDGKDIAGYTRKQIPNEYLGISKSGRNLRLNIDLSKLYPTIKDGSGNITKTGALDTDGKKRFIIKATDSPVNKLWYALSDPTNKPNESIPGTPMGAGDTNGEDESVRVSRYAQFAFIYDAIPPAVIVTKPKDDMFGANFKDDFTIAGSISDMNLATKDGKYYIEYSLNSQARKTFILDTSLGVTVDAGPVSASDNTTIVKFTIPPNVVVQHLITQPDFDALAEGQHTLNIFAWDKSGQEGAGWASFTKDTKPPVISFSNLNADSRPYDNTNRSRVHRIAADGGPGWWNKTSEQRQTILFTDNPLNSTFTPQATGPLKLTTISYDATGIPQLRGTITDTVSNISIKTKTDSTVGSGDVNDISGNPTDPIIQNRPSSFRYWIDNDGTDPDKALGLALIDGKGTRSIRWTINLTKNGTTATGDNGDNILCDGVHTIVLTASDVANPTLETDKYMIAFRIDSQQPKSAAGVAGNLSGVYGNVQYQNPVMFTLDLGAQDANLDRMTLSIVKQGETTPAVERVFKPLGIYLANGTDLAPTATGNTNTWGYVPYTATALPTSPALPPIPEFTPPLSPNPNPPLKEDYVVFIGKFNVQSSLFTGAVSGKYDVKVIAYDTNGNKSEEFTWTFTYDNSSPKIQFTSPDDETQNGNGTPVLTPQSFIVIKDGIAETIGTTLTPNNKINRLTSENLRITGLVIDEFSAISEVQSLVEKWNWTNISSTPPNVGGTWTTVQGWTAVRKPEDLTSLNQLQISWTKNLLGQNSGDLDLRRDSNGNPLPAGTANTVENLASAEGLYRIRIRAKDSSTIANSGPVWNTGLNTPDTGNPGQGNPVISQYVYFYFDRNNPKLDVTKINGEDATMATYYTEPPTGGFSFKGTVEDNNRFAKVEVKFEVAGKDPIIRNARLTTLTVAEGGGSFDPATPNFDIGGKKQGWEADGFTAGTLLDGRYKVSIVAYDMTGRSTSVEKTFNLDTTKPQVKFTLPAKEAKDYKGFGDDSENPKPAPVTTANGFASKMVLGGENAVITGVTEDKPGPGSPLGSESGIDQMWFHLGFIDDDTNFPTWDRTARTGTIKTWEDTLITRYARNVGTVNINANGTLTDGPSIPAWNDLANLTIKQRNRYMDLLSERRITSGTDTTGNAWFKLGGTEKPTGFIINNPNIYDWRFEIPSNYPVPTGDPKGGDIDLAAMAANPAMGLTPVNIPAVGGTPHYPIGGLKLYGNTIRIKGREYTVGSGPRQMVRAVEGQAGGVYRLPLWVRITDIAGNVEYYCHDIWIDMNGDIPSTSIESPSNGNMYNARGGAISVDGVAKSNTSVYDVIFRVFADNVPDTNLDGVQTTVNGQTRPATTNKWIGNTSIGSTPNVANIVRITGYSPADAASVLKLPNTAYYRPAPGATWNWQKANLTLTGGSGEPLIPWSIMLNSEDQLAKLIATKGFISSDPTNSNPPATNPPRDTIRVWLEVFVLSGEGSPGRTSIYMDDKKGTGNGLPVDNLTPGPLYGVADPPNTPPVGAKPYVKAFYISTGAAKVTYPNVGVWYANYREPNPLPTPAPFRRANFYWNGEAGEDDGGYKGAGTETRSNRFAISATLDPSFGNANSRLGEVAYRIKINDGSYLGWNIAWDTNTLVDPANPNSAKANPEQISRNGVNISLRTTPAVNPPRTRYYFDYAINSKATGNTTDGTNPVISFAPVNGGNWANTGGTVTVQVRMRDNSTPPNEAEKTIQVGVDNFVPIGGDEASYGNKTVAGTNVTFQGRVYDFSTAGLEIMPKDSDFVPKKVKRVYAWFTKTTATGTYYVNMNTGVLGKVANNTTAGTPATQAVTAFSGRVATITGGGASETTPTVVNLTNAGTTTTPIYVPQKAAGQAAHNADFVREIDQATGQPANKMLWSPVQSFNYDIKWQFTLDSTKLPDGPITLHYLVEDEAGNASYYVQPPITVKNNYPEITRVTLYTDNNGQGAAFTKDDTIEYDLNDYRAKMFYNYTDTADNVRPAGGYSKSDTTGYLNSGFIAKNNYIGFRVETLKGNRPLTFRLQHVTRTRETLTATKLQELLRARNTANNINLYTIAWHGDYSAANWRAIGVPLDKNPTLGMHFVLQWPEGSSSSTPNGPIDTLPAGYKSSNAEVWKYTLRTGKPDVRPSGNAQSEDPAVNNGAAVMAGPDNTFPGGVELQFKGDTDFNGTNPNNSILEKNGSRPDVGDTNPDYPIDVDPADSTKGTAFFLIRVWDSVGGSVPLTGGTEAQINEKLHDALVVGMNVYKRDNIYPVARLYDLNPYTEAAVANSKDDTIRNAANPIAIGRNIVRGGLYNDGTAREPVRSGFINPRNGSKALNPNQGTEAAPVNGLANGIYDKEETGRVLINGLTLPDYPLRVASDTATRTDTDSDRDQVSGKIILRGIAWDDQLIDEIRLNVAVNATNPDGVILKLNSTGKMAAAGAGIRNGQIVAFAAEELHWKTGHTVEWAYVWDTSSVGSGGPTNNVPIQVTVKDKKGSTTKPPFNPDANPGGLSSNSLDIATDTVTGNGTLLRFHNTVTVNIVPYITGFERKKPELTTKRSLQGWYSFYRGEGVSDANTVKVRGYNFGTAGTTEIRLNNVSVGTVTNNSSSERTFSIPANANSGAITMTVNNGTSAYNNSVDIASATGATIESARAALDNKVATKSWNCEYSSLTPGSDLWINRHYAHIWRSNEEAGSAGNAGTIIGASLTSEGMDNPPGRATPSMALQYTASGTGTAGTLHAAWAKYNRDEVYYGTNTGNSQRQYRAGEPYTATDIDYYNGTNINTDNRYNASILVSYQRDGGPRLVLKAALEDRDVSGGDDDSWVVGAGVSSGSTSSSRWKNTRIKKIAVSQNTRTGNHYNNPGIVITSAFDSYDNRLHYSRQSGVLTNTTGNYLGNRATQFFLDGGGVVETGTATDNRLGGIAIFAASITANNTWGTIGRSNSAGQYNAIDYDSNGRPVIAYFDDQNQTLRLLYVNTTGTDSRNPTSAAAWTRRYVLPEGHALRLGSGSYVSMKIQRTIEEGNSDDFSVGNNDKIHLAFYNSNNKAIVYAVGTRTGNFTAAIIDRVVEGGQWTDIALDQSNNPWITYADSTRTGNRDGVRIAYRSFSSATDTVGATGTAPANAFGRQLTDSVSTQSIRGWEALTMPANYNVNDDRLNIAAWPPKNSGTGLAATNPIGGWNAAVGYSGSDKFRIGYFFKPPVPTGF